MVAFEVLLNGKRLYTMGIGDFGVMSAHVTYHRVKTKRGPIEEGVMVHGTGHNSTEPENHRAFSWDWIEAKVGDEITIRIVETETCDPGSLAPSPE